MTFEKIVCDSCVYFDRYELEEMEGDPNMVGTGLCRRYPPRMLVEENHQKVVLPTVSIMDWCGDAERKKESRRPIDRPIIMGGDDDEDDFDEEIRRSK
jgi:hypothetical protein